MQLDEVVTQGTDWYQVDPSKIEENSSSPAPEGPVVAHKREGKTLAILNENADAHDIPKPDPETEPWVVAGDNYQRTRRMPRGLTPWMKPTVI